VQELDLYSFHQGPIIITYVNEFCFFNICLLNLEICGVRRSLRVKWVSMFHGTAPLGMFHQLIRTYSDYSFFLNAFQFKGIERRRS